VVGFSNMSAQEVADACGLPLADARLARRRDYDEPFRVVAGGASSRDRLCRGLRRAGVRCVAGGRFDHAIGGTDKGTCVARLGALYRRADRRVLTVGLGDSLNDLPLLRQVDIPVIVRNPAAAATARLRRTLPAALVTEVPGPAGWAQAVNRILAQHGVAAAHPALVALPPDA
jgi:mannosyl-3-phosphoglycerate phosphatase